jgi:flavin reductase (DIM6/NTAB) family NADH-FMN oxidoreductase RutF
MPTFDANDLTKEQSYKLLNSSIVPRPIAWVSTVSEEGIHNLAPFSWFNAVAVQPPTVAFSVGLDDLERGFKDTYVNLNASGECVINIVTAPAAAAMNICGTAFDPTTDEFAEAGVTPVKSELVRPMRVQESPVQLECKLHQVVTLGNEKGRNDLMICSVLLMHVHDDVYIGDYKIDPDKLQAVGRMGGTVYTRTRETFTMERHHIVENHKPA